MAKEPKEPKESKAPKEPKEPKAYELLPEAQEMVKSLCQHPQASRILWSVQPENVAVLCIVNKERPQGNKALAKITRVTGPTEALLSANNIDIKYVIELYAHDWKSMSNARRQALIFGELLHIPPPVDSGLVKYDVEDFALMIEAFGANWTSSDAAIPEILAGEVEFNLRLAPNGAADK